MMTAASWPFPLSPEFLHSVRYQAVSYWHMRSQWTIRTIDVPL